MGGGGGGTGWGHAGGVGGGANFQHHNTRKATQLSYISVNVIIFTVNYRRPLPLRELHSTDETRVWRDPGGS